MHISKDSKILVLAPHTDDGEFGCGGTIAKLVEQGNEVYQVAFSSAYNIVEDGMINSTLEDEIMVANEIIGVPTQNIYIHGFKTREFHSRRQDILDLMIHYRNKIDPDIVFIPSLNDVHQDHGVIAQEALRSFKQTTILGYELAWNLTNFNYQLFISLTTRQLEKKLLACQQYKSQKHRPYYGEEYFRSLAVTRGVQANTRYAETFEVIRINLK